MKKSAFISDILFAFAVTFIPALCLFRYLRIPLSASLLFAAAAGILVALPVWFFLDRKREKLFLKKQDEETMEKLMLHLALSTPRQNAEFFRRFFAAKEENGETKTLYFPLFTVRPADGDEAAAVVRAKTEKQKCILCGQLSPEAEKLCSRLNIQTKVAKDVYAILKEGNALPEHYLCEEAFAKKKKKRLKLYFAKSNSRHFLLGGILILLTSLITPFPLYYLIFGSALIISSVFVRIFGYR